MVNRCVIFFAKKSVGTNSGKSLIKDLDIFLLLFLFKTVPCLCLFWLKDCESDVPIIKICLFNTFLDVIS